jgi:hypothetical protein
MALCADKCLGVLKTLGDVGAVSGRAAVEGLWWCFVVGARRHIVGPIRGAVEALRDPTPALAKSALPDLVGAGAKNETLHRDSILCI